MAEGSDTSDRPGGTDWPDDPVEIVARVFALRQMADLGGFPHMPEWDRMEQWALARLTPAQAAQATGAPAPSPTAASGDPLVLADPFLAFAEVSAARLVADEEGLTHAKSWDETEQAVREQLSRSHTGADSGADAGTPARPPTGPGADPDAGDEGPATGRAR